MKKTTLLFVLSIFSTTLFSQDYWQEINSDNYNYNSLSVSANGNIFVSTDTFLIRSADHGLSWENINYAGTFGASPTGIIYLLKDSIYKSYDEGDTWMLASDTIMFAPWFLICSPEGDIYTETGVLIGSYSFRSIDEGSSWQKIGVIGAFLYDIIFKDNLIIAAYENSPAASDLYKSTDKGDTWENISAAPENILTLFVSKNGYMYGGRSYDFNNPTADFLFRSTDDGITWSPIGAGVIKKPVKDIEENQLGDLFVSVDSSGVFRSTDNGSSWEPINDGLTLLGTSRLIVDSLGYLYVLAGTTSFNPAKLFRSVESTIPVELISFSAKVIDNEIHLTWVTATETNNAGFEIQKSETGNNNFKMIGYIEGNGTTAKKNIYSFINKGLTPGKYHYRLKQIDYDGSFEYSQTIEVEILLPNEFALYQNYPNPFNPVTKIKYSIGAASKFWEAKQELVTLKIYDMIGNEAATLINEMKSPGNYEVEFDAGSLSSGIYFYQLNYEGKNLTKKMIYLK